MSSDLSTQQMVERLDRAVQADSVRGITSGVKDALIESVKDGSLSLDESVLVPCPDGYGRRLLHQDPEGRYSVVAMIWGEGQGTPIHDHDDKWCVECVYQGNIDVTSYDLGETPELDKVTMELCGTERAIVGSAGALIPPHDYHVIHNTDKCTAVTIHVYGGEMTGCNIYVPVEGGTLYERQWKSLCYSD
jgi:predicted metal-dependent enzyme (double-stranded beta helix superfamily)